MDDQGRLMFIAYMDAQNAWHDKEGHARSLHPPGILWEALSEAEKNIWRHAAERFLSVLSR